MNNNPTRGIALYLHSSLYAQETLTTQILKKGYGHHLTVKIRGRHLIDVYTEVLTQYTAVINTYEGLVNW